MKRLAVEVVVFTVRVGRLEALLVRGPGNAWALPGRPASERLSLAEEARTALAEMAGVRGVELEQLYSFDRDDGAGVTVAHMALIAAEPHPLAPGPGVVEVRWCPLDDLPDLPPQQAGALEYGLQRLRAKSAYAPIAFQLMPEAFTMRELAHAYEAVLGTELDPRNFRRDVLAAGIVEQAGRARPEGPGRPAKLYRSVGGEFSVIARERRIARAITGADRDGPPATEGGDR